MKYEKGSFIVIPNKQILLKVGGMEQALFMWLCDMANVTGNCFPSRTTLAAKLRCSVRAIDGYMNELIRVGLVVKENRFKGNEKITNLYSIPLSSSAESALPSAKSALPLGQNLPIELNIVGTQQTTGIVIPEPLREERETPDSERVPKAENRAKDKDAVYQRFSRKKEPWMIFAHQRKAALALFDRGLDKLDRGLEIMRDHSEDQFCPQASTPTEYVQKMPSLNRYIKRNDL